MKIIPLPDNALFLTNWRERMRFAPTLSYIILTIITLILLFLSAYFRTGNEYNPKWPQEMFWFMIVGQGILILLLGTMSAENISMRERFGGTLDFHRSSPTPRFHQILGLATGSPCLEWCIFFYDFTTFALYRAGGKTEPDRYPEFLFFFDPMRFILSLLGHFNRIVTRPKDGPGHAPFRRL